MADRPTSGASSTKSKTKSRIQELAEHKTYSSYTFERELPTSIKSLRVSASPSKAQQQQKQKDEDMAKHKTYEYYTFPRSVYTEVSPAAKQATVSPRVEQLYLLKTMREKHPSPAYDMGFAGSPIVPVGEGAKNAECTPRVKELSKEKDIPKGYEHEKPVPCPVSNAAMNNAVVTPRTEELAKPKVKANKDNATEDELYKVTSAALRATPTARINELAQPVNRNAQK